MIESLSGSDLINELAHEFAERYRRGERPPVHEYTDRYPDLAGEIRELFPTLVLMEQFGSGVENRSGPEIRRPRVDLPAPERLGDYRILREIGRGGMGIVYEAVQESLGRQVALKVLTQHSQLGAIQLLRFEREARAAALLHHTNIVPVFGVGEHQGVHYYAMQYIEGQSLDVVLAEIHRLRARSLAVADGPSDLARGKSASLAQGLLSHRLLALRTPPEMRPNRQAPTPLADVSPEPPPPGPEGSSTLSDLSSSTSTILGTSAAHYFRSVARLGMQAAEALGHAHQHGVLHRDIKPANLLLDLRGTVWVTDFGLAKAEGSAELTSPGDVVGTLRYMAPERFHGKADSRSDIYSLGLTLYEMLTFAPAYTGSHRAEFIHAILHEEPKRPRSKDPLIPLDLETIILKAIAKNPSDRYRTADELARELGRFVDGRPILSRRVSLSERVWRWSRRNPAVSLLTLLAGLLTTALVITSTSAAWRYREQRDLVREQRDMAQREQRKTQVELARSLLQQVRAERYSSQVRPRHERLEKLAEAARLARSGMAGPQILTNLRGEAIATLGGDDLRVLKTWPGRNFDLNYSSYAFDADRCVFIDGGRAIHLCRVSDGSEIRLVKTQSTTILSRPQLDSTGRFVYAVLGSAGASRIVLWDLERGKMPASWPLDVCDATFQPDGARIAALRPDGEVVVYDLPAMNDVGRCHVESKFTPRREAERLALSRDGRLLAVMSDAQDAWVHDLANNRLVVHLKIAPIYRTGSMVFNSKATRLAIANDRTISVYDVEDGERLSMLQGHQGGGINAYFETEGNLLFSECWDGMTRVWDPIRGMLLKTLPGMMRGLVGTRSRIVIGRKDDLILYDVGPGAERMTIDCRALRKRAEFAVYGPEGLAFSPDGSMIALALRPDGVRIIRASDGMGIAHLPIGRCNEVQFLDDGSLLTYNAQGLCRWPVSPRGDGERQIGPPEPLAPNFARLSPFGSVCSARGRLVALSADLQTGSLLLDLDRPWRRTWLKPHANVYDVAISPDSRWVATVGGEGRPTRERVKVWEAASGRIEAEIPGNSCVAFSADGQWLGVNEGTCYRFYRTGTWAPVSSVSYEADETQAQGAMHIAFHPVESIAAVLGKDRSTVRLVDVSSGRVLASIEGPNESQVHRLVFSPDGRFLAASHNSQKVDIWDLSLIRHQLQELGLADGFPSIFDGETPAGDDLSIRRLLVKGADAAGLRLLAARRTVRAAAHAIRALFDFGLDDSDDLMNRADLWSLLGYWRFALADYRASLVRRPESALAANNLSWCLVSVPGRGNEEEALRWARKAVAIEPGNVEFRNTLGVALYRANLFAEAALELESNAARNVRSAGYDWVFLAMCRQRLGQKDASRRALNRALAWRAEATGLSPDRAVEFQKLLDEAHALLDETLPDLPPDPFGR